MLTSQTISKSPDHEVIAIDTPEGRWTLMATSVTRETRIQFRHRHPQMDLAEVIIKRQRATKLEAQALRKFVHDQNVGCAASLEEAKIVVETLCGEALPVWEDLLASSGYTLTREFQNERGEFMIYDTAAYTDVEMLLSPEMTSIAVETSEGSEHIVVLYDPTDPDDWVEYPSSIDDYRAYALRASNEILRRRAEAGDYRKPL